MGSVGSVVAALQRASQPRSPIASQVVQDHGAWIRERPEINRILGVAAELWGMRALEEQLPPPERIEQGETGA